MMHILGVKESLNESEGDQRNRSLAFEVSWIVSHAEDEATRSGKQQRLHC